MTKIKISSYSKLIILEKSRKNVIVWLIVSQQQDFELVKSTIMSTNQVSLSAIYPNSMLWNWINRMYSNMSGTFVQLYHAFTDSDQINYYFGQARATLFLPHSDSFLFWRPIANFLYGLKQNFLYGCHEKSQV